MGRHEKPIDWDQVERRMEAGNSAKQIATYFRIHVDTFYERFKKEYGIGFPEKSDEFLQYGNSNIEYAQYVKAMSGNVQMLLWLGQIRCNQAIPQSKSHIPENDNDLKELTNSIREQSKKNASQSETN